MAVWPQDVDEAVRDENLRAELDCVNDLVVVEFAIRRLEELTPRHHRLSEIASLIHEDRQVALFH